RIELVPLHCLEFLHNRQLHNLSSSLADSRLILDPEDIHLLLINRHPLNLHPHHSSRSAASNLVDTVETLFRQQLLLRQTKQAMIPGVTTVVTQEEVQRNIRQLGAVDVRQLL